MRINPSMAPFAYGGAIGLFLMAGCAAPDEGEHWSISRLTAAPATVDLGSSAQLSVELAGPEPEELAYAWTASGGWIRGSGSSVYWDAPLEAGHYAIAVRVSDSGGATDSAVVEIVVAAEDNPLGHWITRAPLPTARQELATAVLDGRIYVVGGMDAAGTALARVDVFDPEANSWSVAAPLPEPRHHLGLAAAQGRIYAIGGVSSTFPSFSTTSSVFAYDPASDTWTDRSPMPIARRSHIAVELAGKIYVIGGHTGSTSLSTNQAYDPVTDTWEDLAPMSTARNHLTAAVLDSVIYVVGGRAVVSEEGTLMLVNYATLERYSPAADSWTRLHDMRTARSGLAAASVGGLIYVMGGEIPDVYSENEVYEPLRNFWQTRAPMLTGRHGMTASVVDGVIYLIGGGVLAAVAPSRANEGFVP